MNRRVIVSVLAVVILAISVFVWRFSQRGPDSYARQFARALQRQNWEEIYEMSSQKEKSLQHWGRSQYSGLLSEISRAGFIEVMGVEYSSEWIRSTSKSYWFDVTVAKANRASEKVRLFVQFMKGPEDWHPVIGQLPLDLHNLKKRPTRASLRRLVAACKNNNIRDIARMHDSLVFSIVRLEEYLEGQVEWDAIYTRDRM